jgi:nucleotide-binding universal stress UspA family protein
MLAKRILVPLDHTPNSEAVLPFVADLARSAGSTVRLLRVDPVPNNVVRPSGQVVAYTDQEMARLEAEGLAYLDASAALLQGIPVERVVRFGDPAQEILIEAEAFGADIIALTTSIRSALRWTLSRSSAARIFRKSKVPVLVLRHNPVRQPSS